MRPEIHHQAALVELAARGMQAEFAVRRLQDVLHETIHERDEALDLQNDETATYRSVMIPIQHSTPNLSILVFWQDGRGAIDVVEQFENELRKRGLDDFHEVMSECGIVSFRLYLRKDRGADEDAEKSFV